MAVEIEKIDAPDSAESLRTFGTWSAGFNKNRSQLEKWLGAEMAGVLTEIEKEDLKDPTSEKRFR